MGILAWECRFAVPLGSFHSGVFKTTGTYPIGGKGSGDPISCGSIAATQVRILWRRASTWTAIECGVRLEPPQCRSKQRCGPD